MKDFNDEIKHQLDAQADNLSQPIQDKLAAARKQALLQAKRHNAASVKSTGQPEKSQPAANDTQWLKPLLALAACVCLVVPLWLSGVVSVNTADVKQQMALANPTQPSNLSPVETEMEQHSVLLELASLNDDELELVENLDFALWLLQQEQSPS
jgi:hypothetical protein